MPTIGIDTGGTFTDLAFYDPEEGRIEARKVPSTGSDPSRAVLQLLSELGPERTAGSRIVHGTTVATNILLERSGADLVTIATEGFRDLLEIGRTRRASPGLFDTKFVKQPPLVRRSRRFEVPERLGPGGQVLRALEAQAIESICRGWADSPPDAVVVCFLHSYARPDHEREARDLIRRHAPGVPVILSSEVVPEYREFERLTTSVINAYVLPPVQAYLERLACELGRRGERLYVMGSNGGILTAECAGMFPARTILSGPAGGVNGAILSCQAAGVSDVITCDMGGTSTDVALVRGAEAAIVQETTIAGLPLKLPQLDINTVGAGGGSIAWVDVDGRLRVGPQSAGADPGPACYGRGGNAVAVTDANMALGRIGADALLAGTVRLDLARSLGALDSLADKLSYPDREGLAAGVIRLAVARMASAIREISVERGHDQRKFTLLPLGGAGPMHVAELADELGISRVLVPRLPGNLSALGLIGSDIRYDFARTMLVDARVEDRSAIAAGFAELAARGRASLEADGFGPASIRTERIAEMRYRGQAFDLSVSIPHDDPTAGDLIARFERGYERRYGHLRAGRAIDIATLRVVATGVVPRPELARLAPHVGSSDRGLPTCRPVYFDGRWHEDCPVYRREQLGAGFTLKGPAIVEEYGSTTVVPPHWQLVVDPFGNLRLDH